MSFNNILLVIYLAAGVLPFFTFQKHYFIRYFIAAAAIDPFYWILSHYHFIDINSYVYFSFALIIHKENS